MRTAAELKQLWRCDIIPATPRPENSTKMMEYDGWKQFIYLNFNSLL